MPRGYFYRTAREIEKLVPCDSVIGYHISEFFYRIDYSITHFRLPGLSFFDKHANRPANDFTYYDWAEELRHLKMGGVKLTDDEEETLESLELILSKK